MNTKMYDSPSRGPSEKSKIDFGEIDADINRFRNVMDQCVGKMGVSSPIKDIKNFNFNWII